MDVTDSSTKTTIFKPITLKKAQELMFHITTLNPNQNPTIFGGNPGIAECSKTVVNNREFILQIVKEKQTKRVKLHMPEFVVIDDKIKELKKLKEILVNQLLSLQKDLVQTYIHSETMYSMFSSDIPDDLKKHMNSDCTIETLEELARKMSFKLIKQKIPIPPNTKTEIKKSKKNIKTLKNKYTSVQKEYKKCLKGLACLQQVKNPIEKQHLYGIPQDKFKDLCFLFEIQRMIQKRVFLVKDFYNKTYYKTIAILHSINTDLKNNKKKIIEIQNYEDKVDEDKVDEDKVDEDKVDEDKVDEVKDDDVEDDDVEDDDDDVDDDDKVDEIFESKKDMEIISKKYKKLQKLMFLKKIIAKNQSKIMSKGILVRHTKLTPSLGIVIHFDDYTIEVLWINSYVNTTGISGHENRGRYPVEEIEIVTPFGSELEELTKRKTIRTFPLSLYERIVRGRTSIKTPYLMIEVAKKYKKNVLTSLEQFDIRNNFIDIETFLNVHKPDDNGIREEELPILRMLLNDEVNEISFSMKGGELENNEVNFQIENNIEDVKVENVIIEDKIEILKEEKKNKFSNFFT